MFRLRLKNEELVKLRDEGCEVNIFCMFDSDNGQGGAALSVEIMRKLCEFELDVIFDVYADCN